MIMSLGHSTWPITDFIDVCRTANIDTIIDTRSHPGSTNSPQYNRRALEKALTAAGIGYEWWPGLGGWDTRHRGLMDKLKRYDVDLSYYVDGHFPKQRIAKKRVMAEDECGFTNYGFHDYQFFMVLDEFIRDADRLVERGKSENVACICCEACWTKCHRSMIADYLNFLDVDMVHVTPRFRKIKQPRTVVTLKKHSEVMGTRALRYHPDVIQVWFHKRAMTRIPDITASTHNTLLSI